MSIKSMGLSWYPPMVSIPFSYVYAQGESSVDGEIVETMEGRWDIWVEGCWEGSQPTLQEAQKFVDVHMPEYVYKFSKY